MPPPWDTVVSIGGQSFVDGFWRLLGPALEGLTNPLPIALPGFTNAQMRITQIVPVFPGVPPPTGALNVLAAVEVTAEALLNVNVSGGDFTVSLGPQDLVLENLNGTINLPVQDGQLTDIAIAGNYPAPIGRVSLGPGTGNVRLPGGAASLTNGNLTGTLNLPGSLRVPSLPLPAVVPVAIDLTPSGPLVVGASLVLSVTGITPTTRFGLLFSVDEVTVGPMTLDPALAASVTTRLQAAVNQIVRQLDIPAAIVQRPVVAAAVSTLLAPIPGLVTAAFDDAFTRLLAETGRLVYPPAGPGASCDVSVLPTGGDGRLTVASDGTFVLQVGFNRAGSSDIPAFPTFAPSGIADCTVLVGNTFLLSILCCLVEKLPAFTFLSPATTSTTDVAGATHLSCCNFTGVTIDLGLASLTGGLSLCIDGMTGSPKTFSLVGAFAQGTAAADITVGFTLPISFDLDDVASLANLRVLGTPTVAVSVTPSAGLIVVLAVAGLLFIGPAVGATAIVLLVTACFVATTLLTNAVNTVLRHASLLRSPISLPPGLFEAFGRFAPVTLSVDDLTAHGVLHTPTSPWALLPRIGLGKRRDRPTDPPPNNPRPSDPPLTHVVRGPNN